MLLSSVVLYVRFGDILTASPNHVIQGYGDAFNAYNLVTYHAKYDSTYTAFEGMAYPYGDHVIIASAIPLVSSSLKALKAVGLDLTDLAIPILHYSMLLSYIVCAVFLYLILSRLALPPWYSIVVAIALTFMSPQMERLFGHYGLAHLYAIPATIYFLMRFDERPSWWASLGLFLTVTLTSLIQFYFFAITAFMIALSYGFSFLKKARNVEANNGKWQFPKADFWRYALHFSLQVLLPYLLFTWWIAQYDVPNRPDKPYGFTVFITYWEGIFLSLRMPYYEWINDYIIPIRKVNSEGKAYVGLVAFAGFLTMVGFWFRYLFRKSFFQKLTVLTSKKAKKVSNNELVLMKGLETLVYDDADFLRRLFAMAFVLLVFSFGVPFSLPGLEGLLDYAGPLKQFRSVGRFNWIFYYVLNIVVFTYLYRRLKDEKIWLVLPLLILVYESWQFNHDRRYQMNTVPEFYQGKTFRETTGLDFSKFQAVLPIPYFNVGTDNFNAKVEGRIQQKSLSLSMETGLPSMASMGNRSSVSRAYRLFQTVTEPYEVPAILEDFKNDKPILLMVDTNHIEAFPYLEQGTRFLAEADEMRYYELPLSGFQERIAVRKAAIAKRLAEDSTLFAKDDFLLTDSSAVVLHKSFDEQQSSQTYQGQGALSLNISTKNTIFTSSLAGFKKDSLAVLSFWTHDLRKFPVANTFLEIRMLHPETKAVIWRRKPQIRYLLSAMANSGWSLVEISIPIYEASGTLEVSIVNEAMTEQDFVVDELMIRPEGVDVYQENQSLFWNNRWYE